MNIIVFKFIYDGIAFHIRESLKSSIGVFLWGSSSRSLHLMFRGLYKFVWKCSFEALGSFLVVSIDLMVS